MIKLAFYGKGGIGKSTTVSNIAAAFAQKGLKVLQIGCDPKADSTLYLRHGEEVPTILDLFRQKKDAMTLDEMVRIGYAGVICAEAGGPLPGLGCVYETYHPDVVLYDVLGDVVCGGFAMPMRKGHAEKVFILTSGENMSIHAAANIAVAVDNFKNRGYATLGGLILNRRNVKNEEEKVRELAEDVHTVIAGTLHRDEIVTDAEEQNKIVLEAYPDSSMAQEYRLLADQIAAISGLEYPSC